MIEALSPIDPSAAVRSPTDGYAGSAGIDADDADRRVVSGLLGPSPVPVDEVVRLSGRAPAIVQTVLLELELAGRLDRHAGGLISLVG